MLILKPNSQHQPIYFQLYQQIKQEIQTGILSAHTKMPSKRQLASQLNISVNTVTAAYHQLVDEGFLTAIPQKGFFVCPLDELIQAAIVPRQPQQVPQAEPILVDFSTNNVAKDCFPFKIWRKMLNNCFNEYDPDLLTSTPAQGDQQLRNSIAQYLYQARSVTCSPEQVIIGAGNDDLLQMLSYILENDCTIGMENPVYHKAFNFFKRVGHQVISFPVDEQGLMVAPLESYQNMAVYITPSHQFPLGISMPISRRIKLLNWANSGSRYIIEDDYDSEFRYQGRPLPSLQSLDKNGRVIYLGTFSNAIAPSLRISYMVLPPQLLHSYLENYTSFSSAVSRFEQAVLNEFIVSGHFETHLNKMRKLYKARRAALIEALSIFGSQLEIQGDAAGLYLLVKLNTGLSETEMCHQALYHGVKVYPISPYFTGSVPTQHQSKVLLGYGALTQAQLLQGAELLYQAWGQT